MYSCCEEGLRQDLRRGVPTIIKFIVRPFFSLSEIMKHLLGQEGEEEEEDEVGPAQIPRKTNQTDHLCI